MNTGKSTATASDYRERILRVLTHIQTHLDEAIGLDELARVACFSPFHFHRIFSGMVGEGVMQHVRRLRLERAAVRLRQSEEQVVRIAFDAGFETHEAFTRAFKAMFGAAPSEFRSLRGAIEFPEVPSGIHFAPAGDGRIRSFTGVRGEEPVHVHIETIKPQRVVFVRHTGPYQDVGKTWDRFMGWVGPRGLFGPGVVPTGVCYDDPQVTPEKCRYDACIPVGLQVSGEGEIGVQEIGGGAYAAMEHIGAYERLGETYARLFGEWLPSGGREAREAPTIERYLNDPRITPPEQRRTEVCVPVK